MAAVVRVSYIVVVVRLVRGRCRTGVVGVVVVEVVVVVVVVVVSSFDAWWSWS